MNSDIPFISNSDKILKKFYKSYQTYYSVHMYALS